MIHKAAFFALFAILAIGVSADSELIGMTVQLFPVKTRHTAIWINAKNVPIMHNPVGVMRSTFYIEYGLAGKGVSFSTVDPKLGDSYLIMDNGQWAVIRKNDYTPEFARRATFLVHEGIYRQSGYSFQLLGTDKFLRRYAAQVKITPPGDPWFSYDATFIVANTAQGRNDDLIGKKYRIMSTVKGRRFATPVPGRDHWVSMKRYSNPAKAPRFKVIRGLSGGQGISFVGYWGKKKYYLSHKRGWIYGGDNLRNANFRNQATWYVVRAFNGKKGYSMRLLTYQDHYMVLRWHNPSKKFWLGLLNVRKGNYINEASLHLV